MDLATLRGVTFAYPGRAPLFDGIDWTIKPGGVYGLLGKNGAGKTTLLKLTTGVLFPHGGTATLFGHDAWKRNPHALEQVYMVSEQFAVPRISVREFMYFHGGYYTAFDKTRMLDYLQRFEVDAGAKLHQLSFGQQKKTVLAFALACGASLVVFDEPTNGLDIPSKQVFRRLLAEAAGEDRAFIISTHQVRDVEHLIDPVVILDNGRVVFDAAMERIEQSLCIERVRDEQRAREAGALAVQHHLGEAVALMPRTGQPATHGIDLELLFEAAVTHPERLREACEVAQ